MASTATSVKNQGRRAEWKRILQRIHDPSTIEHATNLTWESSEFLSAFKKASASKDGDTLRALRKLVLSGTRKACTPNSEGTFSYQTESNNRVVFCQSKQEMLDQIAQTKLHSFNIKAFKWEVGLPSLSEPWDTEYQVVEGDCLEAAESLISRGMNPVVLNMASDYIPGGGYKGGAGAQEENLFRRSNLLRVLANEDRWYNPTGKGVLPPNKFYPLPDPSTVYSPSAYVFRSSEATGYAFLENPYTVAFIASAAYRRPSLESKGLKMTQKFADGFLDKVRAVLWTAASYGHDSIVLSAWGCGAFRNPPRHIAELFKQVLEEKWVSGRFRNITFAIFDDHNARKDHNPEGNVKPFVDVFAPKASKTPTQSTQTASSSEQPQTSSQSGSKTASSSNAAL